MLLQSAAMAFVSLLVTLGLSGLILDLDNIIILSHTLTHEIAQVLPIGTLCKNYFRFDCLVLLWSRVFFVLVL